MRQDYQDFNFLGQDIYDPELTYDLDARTYVVKAVFPDNVNSNNNKKPNEPYILPIYNREQLQKSKYINEQNFKLLDKNLTLGTTDTYAFQFVRCTYHYVLISNSSYYLENFEWKFNLRQRKSDFIRQVEMPKSVRSIDIGGKWDLGIDDFYIDKIQKMKRENYGQLVQLGMSFEVEFPIYEIQEQDLPLIMNPVEFDIFLDTDPPKQID
jgi:hypothetical protein